MSSQAAPSATATIDLQLNTLQAVNPNADAYKLQKGLYYDDDGQVQVRSEIAAKLRPEVLARIHSLIDANRLPEANSIVGCQNIRKPLSGCPDRHEVDAPPVRCGKPLLHEDCATPTARVARFKYAHPLLARHLSQSPFSVLTFKLARHGPQRSSLVNGRTKFRAFSELYFPKGDHGWYWAAAFELGFGRTEFRVIHSGDRLPAWATLNAWWKFIAGRDAELRVQLFDGRDGDTQDKGLKQTFGGFVDYWMTVRTLGEHAELDVSHDLTEEDLTMSYGAFRGFDTAVQGASDAANGDKGPIEPPKPEMPKCATCGQFHVSLIHLPMMLPEELDRRFDRILPSHYGQKRMTCRLNYPVTANPTPSPPS